MNWPRDLKINLFSILKWLLAYTFLSSMLFWPASILKVPITFLNILSIALILVLPAKYKYINAKYFKILSVIISLFAIYSMFIDGPAVTVSTIMPFMVGLMLFCLKDEYKEYLLIWFSRLFSIIVCTSLIFYVIWLIFRYPPLFILNQPFGYMPHQCFIFFIMPDSFLIPRFSGPFVEPGHLGMISAFLIFANKCDFKNRKYLIIILLGILFSLSLSGYVLLVAGLILFNSISIKKAVIFLLVLFSLTYVTTNLWNDGDNFLSETIFNRLEYDEDKGIAGNNRTEAETDTYFSKMMNQNYLIIGEGNSYFREMYSKGIIGGAGYKLYMIQYGILGLFLVFLYYYIISLKCPNKRFAFSLLLLYSISFLQRAYPGWMAWLFPFIMSMNHWNVSENGYLKALIHLPLFSKFKYLNNNLLNTN